MVAITYQCPACKTLVTTNAAVVDADRAGLVCAQCGATSWLPSAGGASSSASVIDVEVKDASPPPSHALVARTSAVPAPRTGAGAPAPWGVEERERVVARLQKIPAGEGAQPELHAAFHKLLDAWTSELEHKSYLKRAQLSGDLAFAGQLYRAVLEAMPLDPFAKKAQNDILTLAMATMSEHKDLGATAPAGSRNLVLAVLAVFLVILMVAFGAKLLRNTLRSDTIEGTIPE